MSTSSLADKVLNAAHGDPAQDASTHCPSEPLSSKSSQDQGTQTLGVNMMLYELQIQRTDMTIAPVDHTFDLDLVHRMVVKTCLNCVLYIKCLYICILVLCLIHLQEEILSPIEVTASCEVVTIYFLLILVLFRDKML